MTSVYAENFSKHTESLVQILHENFKWAFKTDNSFGQALINEHFSFKPIWNILKLINPFQPKSDT